MRALRTFLALALCLGALPATLAAAPAETVKRAEPRLPDIVILSIDTLRADRLGTWGSPRPTSPNLDRIAEGAVVWERCLTPMSTTLPAHVSLVTGMHPYEHGVLANAKHIDYRFRPNESMRSFIELAQAAGYHTAGFVSAAPLDPETGFAAGFEVYDSPEGSERRAGETNEKVLPFLKGWKSDQPLLLFVHYFDPHSPYEAPKPFAGRFEADPPYLEWLGERGIGKAGYRTPEKKLDTRTINDDYDAEVLYTDHEVGRLVGALKQAGLWDESLFVFLGDHGEALGEKEYVGHGDIGVEQLHVPLMMRVPGVDARREAGLIRMQDVMLTLLDMAGLGERFEALEEQASGRSRWKSRSRSTRRVLSIRSHRQKEGREGAVIALTMGDYKYVHRPGGEDALYDIAKDPFERVNVIKENERRARKMRREIDALESAYLERGLRVRGQDATEAGEISPALLERLRSLGYVD